MPMALIKTKQNKTKKSKQVRVNMSTDFYHILVHYIAKGFYLTTTYPNCNATLCGGLKYISESTRVY